MALQGLLLVGTKAGATHASFILKELLLIYSLIATIGAHSIRCLLLSLLLLLQHYLVL